MNFFGYSTLVAGVLLGVAGCAQESRDEVNSPKAAFKAPAETEERLIDGQLRGLFTYMADAAHFEDCADGSRYPVAMEAGYLELERAYLEQRTEPGAPLLVLIRADVEKRPPMEGDGEINTLIVEGFEAAFPGQGCGGN